jgi:hypothetical protein
VPPVYCLLQQQRAGAECDIFVNSPAKQLVPRYCFALLCHSGVKPVLLLLLLLLLLVCVLQGLSHYADWSAGGWHPRTFTAADITPALLHNMRAGKQGRAAAGGTCNAAAAATSALSAIFEANAGLNSVGRAVGGAKGRSSAEKRATSGTGQRRYGGASAALQGLGRHEQLLAINQQQQQGGLQDPRQQQQLGGKSGSSWLQAAGYVPLGYHCPLFGRKFPAAVVNKTLAMALSCNGVGLGSWCHSGHSHVEFDDAGTL